MRRLQGCASMAGRVGGLDEAVECERALNERFPLSDGNWCEWRMIPPVVSLWEV